MPQIVLVLVGAALLIVLGAGFAYVYNRGNATVDERLEEFVGSSIMDVPADIVDDSDGPDVADRVDKAISNRQFFGSVKENITRADMKLRVSEYIVLMLVSGVVVAVAANLFFDATFPLMILAGLVGLRIPKMVINYNAKKRMGEFNTQLGDTLTMWVNALRAGSSVLGGMEIIATEAPEPISVEFERVVQEVRLGISVEDALMHMYHRVPSEDLDLVITATNIQREVGGNLAEVLDSISFTIRERVRIKGEIRTLTAQGRASGWIITFLPIALGFFLYLINPGYVSQLWVREAPFLIGTFPCGWLVLGISLSMIALGGFAIQKIVDIEV